MLHDQGSVQGTEEGGDARGRAAGRLPSKEVPPHTQRHKKRTSPLWRQDCVLGMEEEHGVLLKAVLYLHSQGRSTAGCLPLIV